MHLEMEDTSRMQVSLQNINPSTNISYMHLSTLVTISLRELPVRPLDKRESCKFERERQTDKRTDR